MKTKRIDKEKVNVITLGCSKNLVDSENLITQLAANEIEVVHDSNEASDVVIINTCGFIDVAKEESVNTILQYAELKRQNELEKLYVTGCLSERYKSDLEVEIPEVDAYFGTMELPAILAKFDIDYKHELLGERKITTPAHYAYVKISEGCNRTCSFCAIPLMRGKHISKPIEALVDEVKELVKYGVKEIMLIAQELTYYGLDIYKERKLADLLDALCEIEGLTWIRLHYAYPSKFPREIFDVMARQEKVCNYLDMPLQHASNKVLADMRRQITMEETMELVNYARERVPGMAIRTTMLIGFPGETDEDFNILCDFVQAMKFDRLGVFQYSHEEDTSAHQLIDDVPSEVKVQRANQLMEIQREIAAEKNEAMIGKTLQVLFDRKEGGFFVGRTEFDSPEVDNEVLVDASKYYVRLGDFSTVKITDAEDFDLYGELVS